MMTRAEYALFLLVDGESNHEIEYKTGIATDSDEWKLIAEESDRVKSLAGVQRPDYSKLSNEPSVDAVLSALTNMNIRDLEKVRKAMGWR